MSFATTADRFQDSQQSQSVEEPGASLLQAEHTPQPSPRLKGRRKLLHGLQRMSSSQSLLRIHRSHSSGYRGSTRASISCISLTPSSTTSYSQSFTTFSSASHVSNGYSTAPTSVPSTPGDAPSLAPYARRVEKQRTVCRSPLSVPVPPDARSTSRPATSAGVPPGQEQLDYFSQPVVTAGSVPRPRPGFDFWRDMPPELRSHVLRLLCPHEIVKCSRVSKPWYDMCFDGQLWATLDTASFYQTIPADALAKIITRAGPFARDLNLRGCVQLWDRWRESDLADVCTNLENISLEGCQIDRAAVHSLMYANSRLVHINVQGLQVVSNSTLKIISQHCHMLRHLNVSWCPNVCTKGLRKIVENCPELNELRAGEIRGMGDVAFMRELFHRNTLESLVLMGCDALTDEALETLMIGSGDVERDYLTYHPQVAPRKLKHLDLSRTWGITDAGLLSLVAVLPDLEGLQLSKCSALTDVSLIPLLKTLPKLTHLDLEELENLTNSVLATLASSPCASRLQHLSLSHCENLGDVGMLPVLNMCKALTSLDLDNTRISDLVLIEAATAIRARPPIANLPLNANGNAVPKVGLSMVVYDCQHVTWAGIREVLNRNAENRSPPSAPRRTAGSPQNPITRPFAIPAQPGQLPERKPPAYPSQIINLKTFYGYQPTVTEHTRRCMAGEFIKAQKLERKWAEYMIASEEAGAPGGFSREGFGLFGGVLGRRRRRRVREAMGAANDETDGADGITRRRRARSGGSSGCSMM
ncbi:MAG: hypothetical protein Q9159_004663 [Coniocarpon cinnabarinum]